MNKVETMVNMQNGLQVVIDPDWAMKKYPWWRAIYQEAAEFVEHHGWKWWKKQTPNVDQMHLELVDIYHFVMNDFIESQGIEDAAISLNMIWNINLDRKPLDHSPIALAEDLISYSISQKTSSMNKFVMLCRAAELSFDRLFQLYVQKNVLNVFRQEHGYKSGEYMKNWTLTGHGAELEDNVVLM